MRIPASMRTPRKVTPNWPVVVVGGTVVTLTAFLFMVVPWHQIGRNVEYTELPHALFGDDPSFYHHSLEPYRVVAKGIGVDADGTVWIVGVELRKVALDDLEDTIRRWRREMDSDPNREGRLYWRLSIRAHRNAPWSAVRRVMESAARSGETSVLMEMVPLGNLRLVFVDVLPVEPWRPHVPCRVERVTLDAVPLEEAESTRGKTVERWWQARRVGEEYRPVVGLALANDPRVEDVLRSLECYVVVASLNVPGAIEGTFAVYLTGIGSQ